MQKFTAGGPAYYVLHPQKGTPICLFLTYQAFINREGIIPEKFLLRDYRSRYFDFTKYSMDKFID